MTRTMTTPALMFVLLASFGCGEKDTGTDSSADTGDTQVLGECNTANEDCAAGTCNGEGANMLPGSDCVVCHSQGNMPGDEDGPDKWFSVAGTVFTDINGASGAGNVTIRVTDSEGTVKEFTSGTSGNFHGTAALVPPLNAEIDVDGAVIQMQSPVATGACNSCHNCGGAAGGKLHP